MVKPADYLITNKGDAAVSYPIGYVFGYKSLQRYLGCLFSACYQAIPVARHDRLESEGGVMLVSIGIVFLLEYLLRGMSLDNADLLLRLSCG
jgi:hypothetical protein